MKWGKTLKLPDKCLKSGMQRWLKGKESFCGMQTIGCQTQTRGTSELDSKSCKTLKNMGDIIMLDAMFRGNWVIEHHWHVMIYTWSSSVLPLPSWDDHNLWVHSLNLATESTCASRRKKDMFQVHESIVYRYWDECQASALQTSGDNGRDWYRKRDQKIPTFHNEPTLLYYYFVLSRRHCKIIFETQRLKKSEIWKPGIFVEIPRLKLYQVGTKCPMKGD